MTTARIKRLEEAHVPKYFSSDGYVKPIYVSIERSKHYTESWKETEGEPISIRRAKALAHHLDNMRMSIRPDEFIIGNYADDPHVMTFGIESSDSTWVKGLVESELVKEEERKEWRELVEYWDKRNLGSMIFSLLTEEEKKLALSSRRYVECLSSQMTSRTMPDHELYLSLGVNKILDMLHEKLDKLHKEKDQCTDGRKGIEITLKINDLKAMVIAAEADLRNMQLGTWQSCPHLLGSFTEPLVCFCCLSFH
jgi:benzylsuccinate synthase